MLEPNLHKESGISVVYTTKMVLARLELMVNMFQAMRSVALTGCPVLEWLGGVSIVVHLELDVISHHTMYTVSENVDTAQAGSRTHEQ